MPPETTFPVMFNVAEINNTELFCDAFNSFKTEYWTPVIYYAFIIKII